jgi:hypothetical protein
MAKKTTRSSKNLTSEPPEWAAKITDVADAVVDMLADSAPKGKRLDFSDGSIETLDKLITKLWGDEGPSEQNRETMVWAIGCYVAEVLQRHYHGTWMDGGDGYSFMCEKSGAGASPWNWVAKRFEFGTSESLASKYKLAQSLLSVDKKTA